MVPADGLRAAQKQGGCYITRDPSCATVRVICRVCIRAQGDIINGALKVSCVETCRARLVHSGWTANGVEKERFAGRARRAVRCHIHPDRPRGVLNSLRGLGSPPLRPLVGPAPPAPPRPGPEPG